MVGLELEAGGVGIVQRGEVVEGGEAVEGDDVVEGGGFVVVGSTVIPTAVWDEKVRNITLATGIEKELPLLQQAKASLVIPQQYHG